MKVERIESAKSVSLVCEGTVTGETGPEPCEEEATYKITINETKFVCLCDKCLTDLYQVTSVSVFLKSVP